MHSSKEDPELAESMTLFLVVDMESDSPVGAPSSDTHVAQWVMLDRTRCTAVVLAGHMLMESCRIDRMTRVAQSAAQHCLCRNSLQLLVRQED